jgi:hypothetical protein
MGLEALGGGFDATYNENKEASSSTSISSSGPNIPLVDDFKFLYGRVDEGLDENIELVEAVPNKERNTASSLPGNASSNKEGEVAENPQTMARSTTGMFNLQIYSVSLEMRPPVFDQSKILRRPRLIISLRSPHLKVLPPSSSLRVNRSHPNVSRTHRSRLHLHNL